MRSVLAAASLLVLCNGAKADFWSDAARVVTAPVTAPVEATINVLRGDDPTAPVQQQIDAAGRLTQSTAEAFQQAQDTFTNVQRDAIRNNLGQGWVDAYDALTGSQRIQYELATTGGRFLGKCMQGYSCTIDELTAGPLAAAMRDAYKAYNPYGQALDPNLVQILYRVYPAHVVNAARWTVGATPNFTIPGFLNSGYAAAGSGFAVTLGNVMIFNRVPDLNTADDWIWLLHEMHHIEQYMSYSFSVLESIDGFAVSYMRNFDSMEAEARNVAQQRYNVLVRGY